MCIGNVIAERLMANKCTDPDPKSPRWFVLSVFSNSNHRNPGLHYSWRNIWLVNCAFLLSKSWIKVSFNNRNSLIKCHFVSYSLAENKTRCRKPNKISGNPENISSKYTSPLLLWFITFLIVIGSSFPYHHKQLPYFAKSSRIIISILLFSLHVAYTLPKPIYIGGWVHQWITVLTNIM